MRRYGADLSKYDQPDTYSLSISLCAHFTVLDSRFMIPLSFFYLSFDVSTVYTVYVDVTTKWKCI